MNHNNKIVDTPRTDAARHDEHDPYTAIASECSKLERELNAANQRIKRLEEAGDSILVWMMFNRSHMGGMDVDSAVREWKQAKKEAKP